MVLCELDSLKGKNNQSGDRTRVQIVARKAIDFLFQASMMNDPFIRGQTLMEFKETVKSSTVSSELNNDDRIIECCSYFIGKIPPTIANQTRLILLSNDKNLCVKSRFSNIDAYSCDNFPTDPIKVICSTDAAPSILLSHPPISTTTATTIEPATTLVAVNRNTPPSKRSARARRPKIKSLDAPSTQESVLHIPTKKRTSDHSDASTGMEVIKRKATGATISATSDTSVTNSHDNSTAQLSSKQLNEMEVEKFAVTSTPSIEHENVNWLKKISDTCQSALSSVIVETFVVLTNNTTLLIVTN